MSIADLKEGEKGIIDNVDHNDIPLKLIEMGCLPGNEVELVQRAPFKDPICLSSGFTYEKEAIEAHFKANGQNDPMTREEVNYKMFPNKAIKTAVDDYLKLNGRFLFEKLI